MALPPSNHLQPPEVWRAESPPVSDCDSGAFSQCSSPGLGCGAAAAHSEQCMQCPLISPPLVLSVIKTHSQLGCRNSKKFRINPSLLLSCLSEAGKSSRFSSLQNLSMHYQKTSMFQRRFTGTPLQNKNSVTMLEGARGSLPDMRPDSNLSWWWDNEFGGSDTDTTRISGREQLNKLPSSVYLGRTKGCDKNCNNQVTVNGQHLCSFT